MDRIAAVSAPIETERLVLRRLGREDCTQAYLDWLNDPEINRFLETRHYPQSIETIIAFVEGANANPAEHLFGIFLKADGRHIGNIKVGPVNAHHPQADVSLFIGDRNSWGKGFASEAILALSLHAFNVLGLKKLSAGMYETNLGSYNAFIKAGYQHEGQLRAHALIEGRMVDRPMLGLTPSDLAPLSTGNKD